MRRTLRVVLPYHLFRVAAVWVSAAWTDARAFSAGWNVRGVLPAILFLEEAERFGQSGLPDPEAYSHALGTPATRP